MSSANFLTNTVKVNYSQHVNTNIILALIAGDAK